MSQSLEMVISDLKKQLAYAISNSEWYQKNFKEAEIKILALKGTITELNELMEKKA